MTRIGGITCRSARPLKQTHSQRFVYLQMLIGVKWNTLLVTFPATLVTHMKAKWGVLCSSSLCSRVHQQREVRDEYEQGTERSGSSSLRDRRDTLVSQDEKEKPRRGHEGGWRNSRWAESILDRNKKIAPLQLTGATVCPRLLLSNRRQLGLTEAVFWGVDSQRILPLGDLL